MTLKESTRPTERVKDEVYRQMLRVDLGYPEAGLLLSTALLRGWMVLEEQPSNSELRQWMRTVVPICLLLMDASAQKSNGCG